MSFFKKIPFILFCCQQIPRFLKRGFKLALLNTFQNTIPLTLVSGILLSFFFVKASFAGTDSGLVTHLYVKEKSRVIIVTEKVKKINHFTLSNPDRIVVDFFDAENKLTDEEKNKDNLKDGRIKSVKTSQFESKTVRLVIEIQKAYKYELNRLNGEILIDVLNEEREKIDEEKPLDGQKPQDEGDNHLIEEGDILNIIVSPAEEVSREVLVQPDGKINLLLIGEINVKGVSVAALKQVITDKLKEYVEKPKVSVTVKIFGYRKIFLTGHIARPGVYNYKDNTKLLELVSQAGGFSEKANLKEVKVYRGEGKDKKITMVNVIKLKDEGKDFILLSGDIVEVAKLAGEIFLLGEVKTQGSYEYKENLKLLELIAKAGGFTDQADIGGVRVLRGNPPKSIIVDVGKIMRGEQPSDFIPQPGDIIYIQKNTISGWNWFVDNIVPSITLITALVTAYFVITRK